MPGRRRQGRWAVVLAGGLAAGLVGGGCAFGPKMLERSHGRYNESIRRVTEEQFLHNLVRLRYNEAPLDLTISSIAAQYELNGAAEARPFFVAPNPATNVFRTFTSILPDVSVSGANRPTLTLLPANDGDAVRRFLTPISGDTLVFLAQTSWPVSTVMRLWVERLNGVPNAITASGPQRDIPPDFERFQRVADLMQSVQDRELVSVHPEERLVTVGGPLPLAAVNASAAVDAVKNNLEYRPTGDGASWVLVRKELRLVLVVNPVAAGNPELQELFALLNMQPGRRRYEVVSTTGVVPDPMRHPTPPSHELQATPRSTAQVFFYLANGVEVPCEHVAAGIVRPAVGPDGKPFDGRVITRGLFTASVSAGHKPPANAYVAVKYRGYWFYVDDRDQASKATLSLMLQLSRLDFGQRQAAAPFLTLPVGR